MTEGGLARILCVDDEPALLEGLGRILRHKFALTLAPGPEAGLEAVAREGPFAVVMSDLRMPVMDGVTFLAKVKELAPDTTRVLLTGNADLSGAITAVNEGNVFRFLTKPCPPPVLTATLTAAVEQHRLITAEKALLQDTLRGVIRVLTDVLSVVNPGAFSRATRLREYVRQLATQLDPEHAWQFEVAAMLSQVGCVTVPPDTLEKVLAGQPLTPEEANQYGHQAEIGRRLLGNVPRLEAVAAMVGLQDVPARDLPPPRGPDDEMIHLGAQMLHAAIAFDRAVQRGEVAAAAVAALRRDRERVDPRVLDALAHVQVSQPAMAVRSITLGGLSTTMVLAEDVRTKNGLLVVAKGQPITLPVLERLRAFGRSMGLAEPIRVLVPVDD